VLILNVVVLEPAGTVTVVGTDAAVKLLDSVTTTPPDPAGALRRTVPVALAPPVSVVGLTVRDVTVKLLRVKVAVWLVPA